VRHLGESRISAAKRVGNAMGITKITWWPGLSPHGRVYGPLAPHVSVQTEVQAVTHDRAQGKWDQAKGVAKEQVGKVTGDRSTEVSGKLDQTKGKIEGKIGEAKDSIRRKDDRRR
jgi:uncharacterized protein YjbJ (UPF0337 family)